MTVNATAALLSLTLVAAAATTADAQQRGTRGQGGAQRPAAAQQARGAQCDITSSGSTQITEAYEALGKVGESESDADKTRLLTQATKLLTSTPDKAGTELARSYVLGQTLAAWTTVGGVPTTAAPSTYGFASSPGATVDLLATADSLLRTVETAKPGCAGQVSATRRLAYVGTVNKAIGLYNAATTDPERTAAADVIEQAAKRAASDTSLAEVRLAALQNLAAIYQSRAATSDATAQRELAGKAAGIYRELVAMRPDSAAFQTGLTQALVMSGDSAAITGMNAKMLENPAGFTFVQLLDAGVGALNADRTPDAIKLLEAALTKNPSYRDGLYALAIAYSQAEQHDKTAATVSRLIAVDPNNPDNHQLLANAYQGLLSVATDNNAKRAYTDSLVKTQARAQGMPVKVSFTDFQVSGGNSRVLNGMIENRGTAEASYSLKFEFLDERGQVVATKEEAVAAVPARGSKPFSVSVEAPGATAFRYAPLAP